MAQPDGPSGPGTRSCRSWRLPPLASRARGARRPDDAGCGAGRRRVAAVAALAMVLGTCAALALAGCGAAGSTQPLRVPAGRSVGTVVSVGRPVDVAGEVRQDVHVLGADATVRRGAVIGGDVAVVGGRLRVASGARIGGLVFGLNLANLDWGQVLALASIWAAWALFRLLATCVVLAAGLLITAALPRWTAIVGECVRTSPWRAARVGLWSGVLVLVVSLAVAVTVIGLPLAAALGLLAALAGLVGLTGVGYALGDAMAERLAADWPGGVRKVALGLGLLLALSFIPLLGPLLWAVAFLVGFGAAVTEVHAWVRRS